MVWILVFCVGPAVAVIPGWAAGYVLDLCCRELPAELSYWKCAYTRSGLPEHSVCPECGSGTTRPQPLIGWATVAFTAPVIAWMVCVVPFWLYERWSLGGTRVVFLEAAFQLLLFSASTILTIGVWCLIFGTITRWRPLALSSIGASVGQVCAVCWALWSDAHASGDDILPFLTLPLCGPPLAMLAALAVAGCLFVVERKHQRERHAAVPSSSIPRSGS
ncbi:MAG: hypothetical protein U0637_07780 [Phycisphaerales bacterium]